MSGTGAHYTPEALVTAVVAEVRQAWAGGRPRVLDPSCGDGAFLVGVARWLLETATPGEVAGCLHGIDLDPLALVAARARLRPLLGPAVDRVRLHAGDALLDPPDWRPFDLVLGNPPWVASADQDPSWRAAVRDLYVVARGNWDAAVPFVERALAWTRPEGLHAFVMPNAFCSAPYAGRARALLAGQERLRLWDWSDQTPFDAAAYPVAYLVRHRGGSPGDPEPWPLGEVPELPMGLPRLTERAEVLGAATVAEAYALKDLLVEREEPRPGDLRVVNSGTLDPGRTLWGERPLRYLGQRWSHPVVPVERQQTLSPRRLAVARRPKVIVAGLTRRIEAFVDPVGEWLPAKSTTVVLPHDGVCVEALGRALGHELATAWVRAHHGGQALRGGYLRLGPPQLRSLPLVGVP